MHWGNSLLEKNNNKKRCINTEKEISLMEKKKIMVRGDKEPVTTSQLSG